MKLAQQSIFEFLEYHFWHKANISMARENNDILQVAKYRQLVEARCV